MVHTCFLCELRYLSREQYVSKLLHNIHLNVFGFRLKSIDLHWLVD